MWQRQRPTWVNVALVADIPTSIYNFIHNIWQWLGSKRRFCRSLSSRQTNQLTRVCTTHTHTCNNLCHTHTNVYKYNDIEVSSHTYKAALESNANRINLAQLKNWFHYSGIKTSLLIPLPLHPLATLKASSNINDNPGEEKKRML